MRALQRTAWIFNQHWHAMFGRLYLQRHPELLQAPEHSCAGDCAHPADFGEVKPDGG